MRALLLLLASFAVLATAPLKAQTTPNILVVLADDQSFYTVSAISGVDAHTPRLDALAAEGVLFTEAISNSPYCKPGRNTLFTSLYPHEHGCHTNDLRLPAPDPQFFLPQELLTGGYYTAGFGKWHSSFGTNRAGFQEFTKDPVDLTGSVLQFLRDREGQPQPWFLFVGLHRPHSPWTAPWQHFGSFVDEELRLRPNVDVPRTGKPAIQDYFEIQGVKKLRKQSLRPRQPEFAISSYLAEVNWLDEDVGVVLDELDRLGMTQDTLVLFTSDQGIVAGNHRLWYKGCDVYEETIRVPFIARWPNQIPPGQRLDAPITTLDIAPTLLEAAGQGSPSAFSGQSFWPVMQGQSYLGEEFTILQLAREQPFEGFVRGMRTNERHPLGPWKIVLNENDLDELYDLSSDPYEFNNLASDPGHQTTYQSLRADLVQWMQVHQDPAHRAFR